MRLREKRSPAARKGEPPSASPDSRGRSPLQIARVQGRTLSDKRPDTLFFPDGGHWSNPAQSKVSWMFNANSPDSESEIALSLMPLPNTG